MASVPPPDTPDTTPIVTPSEPSSAPSEVGPLPDDVDMPSPPVTPAD